MISILEVETPEALETARQLTTEYAALPHIAGRWPGAVNEVDTLPGPYARPGGGLFVAMDGERAVGSVAWIRIDPERAELKRLYVRPDGRGKGAGRALVRAVMHAAREAGCTRLRLDTIPALVAANALYASMGFEPVDRFSDDLYPDAHCYELDLTIGS